MTKFFAPHVAIASALKAMPLTSQTDIAVAGKLVGVAKTSWFKPNHRGVVIDALGTLKETAFASKSAGKTTLIENIADTIDAISTQPAEMPQAQNGAGQHDTASQPTAS